MIRSWSYSRLAVFEQCKFRAKLQFIDRVPEPERPLPQGKTEHANDRGTRIHEACEAFVRGTGPMPVEAGKHFADELNSLRTAFESGIVSLEGEWGFDREWNPCDYNAKEVWCRIKGDAVVWRSPSHAVVIDYKTGKKFGNEVKHAEQVQLYALAVLLRFPKVETVTVELWYFDQDDLTGLTLTRPKWMHHLRSFTRRGMAVTSATEFPPNPTIFTCAYCPYKSSGTGHCSVGIERQGNALQSVYARKNASTRA